MVSEKFGANAGLVWNLLDEKSLMNVKDVKKSTKLTDKDLFAAFGWLAREDKINIVEENGELIVSLL